MTVVHPPLPITKLETEAGVPPEAAAIVEQLKETNRLLAIIASASQPLAGHRVAKQMIKSIALDGTVREAEVP